MDGQTDKAAVERNAAYGREAAGLDDLARREAQAEENQRAGGVGLAPVSTGRTQAIHASVILDFAYRMIGQDADQLDDRALADARAALSQALQEVWDRWWWRELMVCATVQFADAVNTGSDYVAGDSVYSPDEDKYFTALTAIAAPSAPPQAGWEEYVANATPPTAWNSATAYAAEDQVRYGNLGYQALQAVPAGTLPTNTTYFAPLQNWVPVLPFTGPSLMATGPYGPVRGVSQDDPRSSANPGFYELDVTGDGTRVPGLDVTHPYVWTRRVTPILTGDAFDAEAAYEATAVEDLVYDD